MARLCLFKAIKTGYNSWKQLFRTNFGKNYLFMAIFGTSERHSIPSLNPPLEKLQNIPVGSPRTEDVGHWAWAWAAMLFKMSWR